MLVFVYLGWVNQQKVWFKTRFWATWCTIMVNKLGDPEHDALGGEVDLRSAAPSQRRKRRQRQRPWAAASAARREGRSGSGQAQAGRKQEVFVAQHWQLLGKICKWWLTIMDLAAYFNSSYGCLNQNVIYKCVMFHCHVWLLEGLWFMPAIFCQSSRAFLGHQNE